MAYVPGFQYDVFISYASDDHNGRMVQFVQDIGSYLRKELGKLFDERYIFFDLQELNRSPVEWKKSVEQSAGSAAILIPFLSPSYATSEYCAKEWEWFLNSHPLRWKAGTEEVFRVCPVKWWPLNEETISQIAPEIRAAQEQRTLSAEELGARIASGLRLMRRSRQTVYLGEMDGDVRGRLQDEMSRMGFRVMPETPMAFGDEALIHRLIGEARLAVHFVGGQVQGRAFEAIAHSCRQAQVATVVYEVPGFHLTEEERSQLEWIEDDLKQETQGDRAYDRVSGKNFDQFLQVVRDRLDGARPIPATRIGIACEESDRAAVEAIVPEIQTQTGFSVICHGLSLLDFKKSRGVLFYWGAADGRRLRQARLVTKGLREAFFLAPPPEPTKREEELDHARILRQRGDHFSVDDIRPFLQELGWTG